MAEGKSMSSTLSFPSKATEETAMREELSQQGMMCAALWCSVLSVCAIGGLIFQPDHHHKPCILGCLSLLAGPREADVPCLGCWGQVLFLCTPSLAGDLQGSLLWWVFPVRAVETGGALRAATPLL